MTLPNWYNIEQIGRDHQREYLTHMGARQVAKRKHSKSRATVHPSHRLLFALSIMLLLSTTAVYSLGLRTSTGAVHPSSTAPSPLDTSSPLVLVNPAAQPLGTVGSTFTVQIKVQNMPQFNGWDIQVYSDPAVVNATRLTIVGNDFMVNASSGTPFNITACVNGAGTGCVSGSDGPGIVHSAYGNTFALTGNGLLFTITYKVTGNPALCSCSTYSPILLQNDGISSPSSGNGVPHTTLSGTYGAIQIFSLGSGGGGGRIFDN